METAITKKEFYNPVKGWLFFLPIYTILIGIAYYASGSIFMRILDEEKYLGVCFCKEHIFNKLLFWYLSIAISAIAFIHFISAFTKNRFTIGR